MAPGTPCGVWVCRADSPTRAGQVPPGNDPGQAAPLLSLSLSRLVVQNFLLTILGHSADSFTIALARVNGWRSLALAGACVYCIPVYQESAQKAARTRDNYAWLSIVQFTCDVGGNISRIYEGAVFIQNTLASDAGSWDELL